MGTELEVVLNTFLERKVIGALSPRKKSRTPKVVAVVTGSFLGSERRSAGWSVVETEASVLRLSKTTSKHWNKAWNSGTQTLPCGRAAPALAVVGRVVVVAVIEEVVAATEVAEGVRKEAGAVCV